MQETLIQLLGWEDPPEKGYSQYSCLENPHGQRSLAGYSPWGLKELDMTKHNTFYLIWGQGVVWFPSRGSWQQLLWGLVTSGDFCLVTLYKAPHL